VGRHRVHEEAGAEDAGSEAVPSRERDDPHGRERAEEAGVD
jgi:hypothetical protein